ncbi:nitrate- and nitrite sensing domain-containing protein [Streptomyces sp. NPDC050504]|uniref:sensor histidine kinase n=1 Tax=Streptomyces sp. NPDC050504 TaxID=3365618 RepID=UPI0037A9508C
MQKKRPRGNDAPQTGSPQTTGSTESPGAESPGRARRVRTRLVASVAAVGLVVIGAGTPAVLTASGDLKDAQNLVTLAELNQQALTLAHSLADERDEITAYIAAGRADGDGKLTDARSTRVDRQIDEIRPEAPAELRRELATVASVRRTALTGKGTALEAHKAYSDVIGKLHRIADDLAERTPAANASSGARLGRAPADLGHAVEQASATGGLLLAALSVPRAEKADEPEYDPVTGRRVESGENGENGGNSENGDSEADRARGALTAAAQQARVRELAFLADFDQAASAADRDSLESTVAGPEVNAAERFLAQLTDRPTLTGDELKTAPDKLAAALSARTDRMRGVQSTIGAAQVQRIEALRDDAVTDLELRIALLGGCLLLAIGVSTATARTLTRPLAVLRIGAARLAAAPDPKAEEQIRFTGRNDEFAQVVRSLNALQGKLATLSSRAERVEADRTVVVAERTALTAELSEQRAELRRRTTELTVELTKLRDTVHHSFVNLSLRSLGLVERQLSIIEKLEEREQDPERLSTLFKLDHLATVMRRHSENLLVLAGTEHQHGHAGPIPLVDVLRAAVSEIERYERVDIQSLPPHAQVAGFAADDLSHLLAELLENATAFSPPDSRVKLSGWLLESGDVMLSVQDEGIGMAGERLAELNARLADPEGAVDPKGEGLGIRVTALLAARHGVRVELRDQKQGGITAVVVLPGTLLPTAPPATPSPVAVVAAAALAEPPAPVNLPGSVAEANSNALPPRGAPGDPETTLQVRRPDPYAIGPDTHERADGATGEAPAEAAPAGADATAAEQAAGTATEQATETVAEQAAETAETAETVEPAAPAPAVDGATGERLTDKGLPKRTPRITKPADAPERGRGGIDAEELRRRLGGFHQGAKDGRRDVEAELSETAAAASTAAPAVAGSEKQLTEDAGDSVEEARS